MHSSWSISARRTRTARPGHPAGRARPPSAGSISAGFAASDGPRHHVGHLLAPEAGHGREHTPLVGDGLGHDHVERADPVRRHHEQAPLPGVVELAHLAGMDPGQLRRHSTASASAKRSTWRSVRDRSKAESSSLLAQRHLRIVLEHDTEGTPFRPRRPRVALDDPVGLVARQSGVDERQEDGLGEDEPQRALREVDERPIGVDHQARGQPRRLAQHVAGQHGRIGQGHPLDRAVRDVPLVPQRDVFEPRAQIPPQQPGQTAQSFGEDGVALVRHGRAALLPGAEGLLRLPHLAAGQVPDLGAHELDGRPDRRAGREVLGVTVPRDHLGGGDRGQAERGTDAGLDGGIDVGVGPDGPRQLAHGDGVAGRPHPAAVAIGLEGPTGRT